MIFLNLLSLVLLLVRVWFRLRSLASSSSAGLQIVSLCTSKPKHESDAKVRRGRRTREQEGSRREEEEEEDEEEKEKGDQKGRKENQKKRSKRRDEMKSRKEDSEREEKIEEAKEKVTKEALPSHCVLSSFSSPHFVYYSERDRVSDCGGRVRTSRSLAVPGAARHRTYLCVRNA